MVYPPPSKVRPVRQTFVATAVLLLAVSLPAQAAWPQFHNDARHTGSQGGSLYTSYEEAWWSAKIDPVTQVEASPIVADGYVVIAGWDGVVRVYDAATGASKWTATMGKIVGTPAVAGGTLFVVDTTGALKSFDLDRGTPLYTAAVGATFASITLHEGKLFVGNEAGVMHAFYADKLTPIWTFAVNSLSDTTTASCTTATPPVCTTGCGAKIPVGAIRGAPVIFDGNVIFGSLNTWIYAVKEQAVTTPPSSWIFKTNDLVIGSPAVDSANHRVLIGSFDEKVYALPTAPSGQGEILGPGTTPCTAFRNTATWSFAVPATFGQSKVESTPAIDGSKAYFGANNGRLYAINLVDGAKAWEFATGAAVVSSPAVSNGIVVAGSDDGKLYWLGANNGTKLTEFELDSSVKASPALDGDKTYIASYEGAIHMLGPEIPKRPDLRVGAIAYSSGTLTFVVENIGTGDAAASKLRLAIDGTFVADLDVPAIAAGSTGVVTYETDIEGSHAVSATVDHAATVSESAETNNVLEQTVEATGAADEDGRKGKGGSGIPGPGVPVLLAALALAGLALRRKR